MTEPRNLPARWEPNDFKAAIERRGDRLDALLAGTGIDRERFIGMTIQALAREPKLLRCTQESVLLSVLSVAEMGLVPNGAPGGAYLVPYGTEAGYIVAYQGLITMGMRSGALRDIYGKVRYEGDEFEVTEGSTPGIYHKPTLDPDRGNVTHFYAVAHLRTGGQMQHVMTLAEVEAIRDRQRNWEKTPWGTADWIEMGRKTPVRNLMKYIPQALTPMQATALAGEDRWLDAGEERPALSSRRQRVLAHVGGGAETAPVATEDANGNGTPAETETPDSAALDPRDGLPPLPPRGPVQQGETDE